MKLKIWLLFYLMFFSAELFAGVYFHVGGGLDYVKHDKSDTDYPMLNLKAGVGYGFSPNLGIELDFTGVSTSSAEGSGTCTTTINTQVSCTRSEEISRQMSVGSVVYNSQYGSTNYFVKGGLALVNSSFNSVFKGNNVTELVLIDESVKTVSAVVSAGIIKSDKHRISGIVSTNYGNSDTGNFGYIGIEYNYLIQTKW